MDDYQTIAEAARNRDWDGCARVMFRQLFFCTAREQQTISANALLLYKNAWVEKHPDIDLGFLWQALQATEQPRVLPRFSESLDPADAEFENGFIEYLAGVSAKIDHSKRTAHFATAVRSSVLAIQINRWIRDFPGQYRRWRSGVLVDGPTFFEDENAATDAEAAWKLVDALFAGTHGTSGRRNTFSGKNAEEAYYEWEQTIV